MNAIVYCAGCDGHVFAVHRDGETLSETYECARVVAHEAGYRELAPRDGRARPRMLCARCIGDAVVLGAAPRQSQPPPAPSGFCFSESEELFSDEGTFGTREEALAAARAQGYEGAVYTGLAVPCSMEQFATGLAANVVDELRDAAFHVVDEASEGWLELTTEDEAALDRALQDAIVAWSRARGHDPRFFHVQNVERHEPAQVAEETPA